MALPSIPDAVAKELKHIRKVLGDKADLNSKLVGRWEYHREMMLKKRREQDKKRRSKR